MTSNLSVCCQRAIDRYKSNNSDLAVNLNAARNEIRALTVLLAQHNGDFQRKCEEFAQLKIELRRVETQMSEWRKQIADVFANNARGLNQLMTLLGVQTTAAPNANSNNNEEQVETPPATTTPPLIAAIHESVSLNGQSKTPKTKPLLGATPKRRSLTERRISLPNVIEENPIERSPVLKRRSSSDATNTSESDTASPPPLRRSRRLSVDHSPSSANSSLSTTTSSSTSSPSSASPLSPAVASPKRRIIRSRSIATPEANRAKAKKKINSAEKENDSITENRRPRRKAAPAQLTEQKLNIKLRRKQ